VILTKPKNLLAKNLLSLTAVQIATYVLPLLSVPIISRIIGPDKLGIINFGAAYIAYFTMLISYSFDFTATRKISKNPGDEHTRSVVFTEVFYAQCLLFCISTIIFVILLFTVPELKKNQTVLIFSYLLCLSTLFTQNWLFQAMQDLSKVAIFNLVSKLLFTVAILLIVRKNEDYIWQPFIIGTIQIVIALWSFIWAFKKYNIKLLKFSLRRCIGVLNEEKIIFFSLIFVNLYSYTNVVILGIYQSPNQVGYFTSAQRLVAIAQAVLTMPLAQAFFPFVGKAFGESREKGLQVVQKLIPLIIFVLGIACIIMFFLGPIVIRIFYGEKFDAAIPIFQTLSITPVIFALNNVLGVQIMLNLKMDKSFFKISALAGLLSVSLNLLLVRKWGYIISTINPVVTEIFIFIAMLVVLKRLGLNPINFKYFKLSSLREYLPPIKIGARKKS
jgi:O-antigen/teichoic acid export membrane protein